MVTHVNGAQGRLLLEEINQLTIGPLRRRAMAVERRSRLNVDKLLMGAHNVVVVLVVVHWKVPFHRRPTGRLHAAITRRRWCSRAAGSHKQLKPFSCNQRAQRHANVQCRQHTKKKMNKSGAMLRHVSPPEPHLLL